MWLIYSVLSGLFYTVGSLLTRRVLKDKSDPWAFSFYFSALGALVSLPFILKEPKFPLQMGPWFLILGVGFLIVLHNLLNFSSSKYLEASLNGTITKFRLVWTFIFGIFFLKEIFLLTKLIGTILTIISGIIIMKGFNRPDKLKGVFMAFSATIIYALVVTLYKPLFNSFNSQTLTFIIFLIPAFLNLILIPRAYNRILAIWQTDGWWLVAAGTTGAFANLTMNKALAMGEVSRVPVIIESFLIATLVGENLWLKERNQLWIKVAAATLAIAAAILMKI